ncbi:MAG: LptF/LptG family permease [Cyclobacteriaceae bacterium]|nr:LptF/LptG family permease [Cyclobacteriaceae bacterium]
MKKLDKLIFKSFIGPFFLTFCVVVFIFLLQFLLRHFDDIVGKGLSWDVYARLLAYFSINMTPVSFPLAVLLSSLMTYGNLGEHSEITALKGAGISLTRTLIPMFVFSIVLTFLAYLSNNYFVPKANLKAYSLLYDIRQKAPALNIKEGVFYKEIPGYQIKVNKKFRDGKSLKDVIIYNHTKNSGNTEVTIADSGRMYTILNDRYLVMELYNGNYYSEQKGELKQSRPKFNRDNPEPFTRNEFKHSKFVFSMAAFDLKRTKEELFAGHRYMKNTRELLDDVDSMQADIKYAKYEVFNNLMLKFDYHLGNLEIPPELEPRSYGRDASADSLKKNISRVKNSGLDNTISFSSASGGMDSIQHMISQKDTANLNSGTLTKSEVITQRIRASIPRDSLMAGTGQNIPQIMNTNKVSISEIGADSLLHGKFDEKRTLTTAVTNARFVKNHILVTTSKVNIKNDELIKSKIQRHKIFSQAFACMIMFLIGAPLGSIIKKGGLGFPVIVSIGFFIIFYVFMNMGEKWANKELVTPFVGAWLANFALIPFGLFFLRQARKDARIFEMDFYHVLFDKISNSLRDLFKNQKFKILLNR